MAKEQIIRVKGDTSDFEKKLDQMTKQMKAAGQQMQDVGRSLSKYVTAPLIAAGAASFMASKDFEKSMSKITGLVGVASNQVEKWKDDLLRLGPELGKTPNELADALFFVTSAGIRGAEALDVLRMSAKASVAGLGETKVVADLVTSAMNAYGAETLSASQATDILVAAVREGKAEAPELAASMGQVLPIAAELGVTFDQVGGAMAAMTRTGTNAATAATQLRAIMSGLMKPSKGASDALESMGTSAGALRKQIKEEGLLSALSTVRELTNKFGEDAMSVVFPNIRALAGALDLMGANMSENVQIMGNVANATGSLEQAFDEAANTAQFKWDQAVASTNSTLITLGDTVKIAVIPLLDRFTKMMASLSDWFKGLTDEQRKNVVTWGSVAAAIGPVLLVLGTLTKTVIPALVTGLKTLRTAALGPLGVAIAGMVGLWKLYNFEQNKTKRIAGELASKSLPELERMAKQTSEELTRALEDAGLGTKIGLGLDAMGKMVGATNLLNQARKALGGDSRSEELIQQMKAISQATELVKARLKEEEGITEEIDAQAKAYLDMMGNAGSVGPMGMQGPAKPEYDESDVIAAAKAHKEQAAAIIEENDALFGLNDAYAAIDETLEGYNDTFDNIAEKIPSLTENMQLLGNAALRFGESVKQAGIMGADSLQEFGAMVKQIAKQNIAAFIAEATAGMIKNALISSMKLGPLGLLVAGGAAAAAGGLAAAAFNSIPGFAEGGVVPPGYPDDTYLARLTSGETIIPQGHHTQPQGGDLTARIAGQDLLFVLRQAQEKNMNSY